MLPVMFKNSWFPTVFDEFMNSNVTSRVTKAAPAINVKEDDKAYVMELAAPGIKKEFCRVSLNEEGNLCIAIESKTEHTEEDKKQHYLRREFSYTNYQRNYALPEDVVKDQIAAHVENGILTVTLPKQEKTEKVSKDIEIS